MARTVPLFRRKKRRAKPGRKPGSGIYTTHMIVSCEPEWLERVTSVAESLGIPRAEFARRSMTKIMDEHDLQPRLPERERRRVV